MLVDSKTVVMSTTALSSDQVGFVKKLLVDFSFPCKSACQKNCSDRLCKQFCGIFRKKHVRCVFRERCLGKETIPRTFSALSERFCETSPKRRREECCC